MKILFWLAVPIIVTALAWLAYRIANRPEAPLTPQQSMQAHARFLQVLETPVPPPQPSRFTSSGWSRRSPRPPDPSTDRMTSSR